MAALASRTNTTLAFTFGRLLSSFPSSAAPRRTGRISPSSSLRDWRPDHGARFLPSRRLLSNSDTQVPVGKPSTGTAQPAEALAPRGSAPLVHDPVTRWLARARLA